MGLVRKALATGGILGGLTVGLFSPVIPQNGYTFTSVNNGNGCEVTRQERQTSYSLLRQQIGKPKVVDKRVVHIGSGTGYQIAPDLVLTAQHSVPHQREIEIHFPVTVNQVMEQYTKFEKRHDNPVENEQVIRNKDGRPRIVRWIYTPTKGEGWNDYRGELVYENSEMDLALVRTTQKLPWSNDPVRFPENSPPIGTYAEIRTVFETQETLPARVLDLYGTEIEFGTDIVQRGMSGSVITDKDGRIMSILTRKPLIIGTREEWKAETRYADFGIGVDTTSIKDFLGTYCDSVKPKDSILQSSGNSHDRQFYERHGYSRRPPQKLVLGRR